jgi:hypothetical protein
MRISSMENNPLRQYFRRPAVHVKLPSGGLDYPEGVIDMPPSGELPVYPMTAIDEITARTPDALYNGVAVTELIKSCVPNIKDPWQINSNDLDAILIAIKAAAGEENLDIESICPKCTESSTYGISLVGVLSTLKSGDYSQELEVGDLKIKLRPLTYKEMNVASLGQFEVQKLFANIGNIEDEDERNKVSKQALEKITNLTMDLLSQAIEYVQTPSLKVEETEFILDFLRNCDRTVYIKIRDYNAELKMSTEIKPLQIKCIHCENEYEQPFTINPTDFFG